jgi:hypothetical protein
MLPLAFAGNLEPPTRRGPQGARPTPPVRGRESRPPCGTNIAFAEYENGDLVVRPFGRPVPGPKATPEIARQIDPILIESSRLAHGTWYPSRDLFQRAQE